MSRVWRSKENLRVSLCDGFSKPSATVNILKPEWVSKMIQVLVSILALISAVSVAYLLTVIDSIVHSQLYQFGLNFSYDWADPYWIVLKASLALLGLTATAASMNITYFFWRKVRKPKAIEQEVSRVAEEEAKTEVAPQDAAMPSLFRCTSCGRSITHPLRMLDFHSQRPKMINICPFCNATVVPASYTYSEEVTSAEEDIRRTR